MSSPVPHSQDLCEKNPSEPPAARRSRRTVSLDEPSDSDPEAPVLPPPVVALAATHDKQKKAIRLDVSRGLRVHWARFRRRLGPGTSLSTSSLVEDSAPGSNVGHHCDHQGECECEEDTEVDEVVVDRSWSDEIKSSVSLSEQDVSLDKPGGINLNAGSSTDRDSVAPHTRGFWGLCTPLIILRWRVFPAIFEFFSPKFLNQKSELHYVKENWFMRKVCHPPLDHL